MATVEVTDATFDQVVLKSDKPVLVDYWADWCAPCKQIAPVLEELSNTYAGQLVIAKIDTNTNMNTPARFGVMGLRHCTSSPAARSWPRWLAPSQGRHRQGDRTAHLRHAAHG